MMSSLVFGLLPRAFVLLLLDDTLRWRDRLCEIRVSWLTRFTPPVLIFYFYSSGWADGNVW
jgi:hypothetical protein